jgi:hypothetical protein
MVLSFECLGFRGYEQIYSRGYKVNQFVEIHQITW